MNRAEWYVFYRQKRLEKKANPPASISSTSTSLIDTLKELYGMSMTPSEWAKYQLIRRYESKVSRRLIDEFAELKINGQARGRQLFKTLMYSENPLLNLIPKDSYGGLTFPVPILIE